MKRDSPVGDGKAAVPISQDKLLVQRQGTPNHFAEDPLPQSHPKNICTIWFNSPSQIWINKLIVKACLKAASRSNLFKGHPNFTDPGYLSNSKSATALLLSGTSCFSSLPFLQAGLISTQGSELSAPVLGQRVNSKTSRCRITVWFNLPEA